MRSQIEDRDAKLLETANQMRQFAIEKYSIFQGLWTTFDNFSVISAICIAFCLMMHFLLNGVLNSTIKITPWSFGFMAFWYAQILLKFNIIFGYEQASMIMILITCLYMIEIDVIRAWKKYKNLQNFFANFVITGYIGMQFSDSMLTEADYVIDSLVMLLLFGTYFVKRSSLQRKYFKHMIDTKKFDDIEDDSDDEEKLSLREKITSNFKFALPYILIIIS